MNKIKRKTMKQQNKNPHSTQSLVITLIALIIIFLVLLISIINASKSNNLSIEAAEEIIEETIPQTQKEIPWNLILVNQWNPLAQSPNISLVELSNNQSVDERCYADLQAMMDDCRSENLSPLICSSYRSVETQTTLYNNKVSELMGQGLTEADAKQQAGKAIAVPGTSEHNLGLAVDIVDINNQNLNETQETTEVQQWLMKNSWKYGFVLRYPKDKSDITGIMYEPWHYRYVGKEAAKEIYEQGICLEEYLENYLA